MAKIRIDKYLADAGFGSRKDVKGLLKAKQVTINGETCVHAERKAGTGAGCCLCAG